MAIIWRIISGLFVVTIVALAIVSGSIRLAIHNIDFFKVEIETQLREQVSPSIVISGVSGDMIGLNPVIGLENISLTLPDRSQPIFIDRLTFEVDFWTSIYEQQPVVREISGDLEKVELVRNADGHWSIYEVELGGGTGDFRAPRFSSLLVLLPRYLKLHLNRLVVLDRRDDKQYQLDAVDVHLSRKGNVTLMQFGAELPDELGSTVTLKSVVDAESTLFYIDSPRLELAPVARLLDLDTHGLQQATLAGEIWLNLSEYQLLSINGKLALADGILQASPQRKPIKLDQQLRFNSLKTSQGWRVVSLVERIGVDGRDLPAFQAQLEIGSRAGQPTLSAWVDRLQVAGLPALAGQWLPERLALQIEAGELSGALANLYFSVNLARPDEFLFAGDAQGLNSKRLGGLPGVQNLDAEIYGSQQRVGARLHGKNLALDFGDEFLEPLRFDTVEAGASLEFGDGRALVSVNQFEAINADAHALGRLWLEVEPELPPFMYLRASFGDGDAGATRKYLPRNVTPAKTLEWLDRAIVGGRVARGGLQYHGRLRDVRDLVRERSGELLVDFDVIDAEVDFAPGWAPVTGGAGRVIFHNTSMTIDLQKGNYRGIVANKVAATIADFENPVLEFDIEADTSVVAALRAWVQMPVGLEYAALVAKVDRSGGDVSARVSVGLPLSDEQEAEVQVLLDFKGGRLAVDDWGLDLSQLNGRMEVSRDRFLAEGIDGLYYGDPVRIEIATELGATYIQAKGLLESKNLLVGMPASMRERVVGKSDWQVRLSLPRGKRNRGQPDWRLLLTSNLVDTALEFPAPLTKPANEPRPISADLAGYADRIDFGGTLGEAMRLRWQLALEGDSTRLEYLDLALNELPSGQPLPGIVLHGSINELDLGGWVSALAETDAGHPAGLTHIDLGVDQLHFGARRLEQVLLDIKADGDQYIGSIDSRQVSGEFVLPHHPSPARPIKLELDRLDIEKLAEDADYSSLRPNLFADLELRCKTLTYHDKVFTDLEVTTRSDGDVLEVERFSLRRDQLRLNGSAQWRYDPATDGHLTSANVRIRGSKVGEAINELGFGDSIRGGTIDFSGGFTWPAPLFDPNLAILVGDAQLQLDNGVLNNVEPGNGRFVGLLSLSAIPRRLALDFSDVLVGGMDFDRITGKYRLADGVMTTTNTRMDGPAAEIKITGRTGVVERDYDQHIRVTPKIRQTLPVIGAISAGSAVGWSLLLLQNLFKKSIDKAVEVEYEVKGSWDDPKITLIRAVDENQQELPQIDR